MIEILKAEGETIAAYKMVDFDESMGVNDRLALATATKIMRSRINRRHMKDGISVIDPERTYIDSDVQIGPDTIIEPGVQLKGNTVIGEDCYIGANSEIRDSVIHDHVTVTSSLIEHSEMLDYSDIGPNSHLRQMPHWQARSPWQLC